MKITKELSKKLYSKLEYNFKKSNNALVEKLKSGEEVELSNDDILTLLKKLEYRFKKSNDTDLKMLREMSVKTN
jgi:DNA-binding Lrp family transcriptional regulator